MTLTGRSYVLLCWLVVSAAAEEATAATTRGFDGPASTMMTTSTVNPNTTAYLILTDSISGTSDTKYVTDIITTPIPAATTQGGGGTTRGKPYRNPERPLTTPKFSAPENKTTQKAPANPQTAGDTTGIVILVLIILVAIGAGLACYFVRKRERSYSVDLTSRQDDANIPLSTVDPEMPADGVPQNGLQTFENKEATTQEMEEPEEKSAEQGEQKAETEGSAAESAALAPPTDPSEDKPPSPTAPVQPVTEDKIVDDGTVSTQTSEESLKDTNENNSNNATIGQRRELESGHIFWDISLDSPV